MKKMEDETKDKSLTKRIAMILMATLLVAGCFYGIELKMNPTDIPELTTFVDATGTVEVQEEEVPLAKPKVTTKKSTKTKKKTVKLKKAAKKTYTKKKPTKKKKTTKTTTKGNEVTKVETTVVTKVTEKYKKKSKKKTVVTKITTTVKTTVTSNATSNNSVTASSQSGDQQTPDNTQPEGSAPTETKNTPSTTKEASAPSTISVNNVAPKADTAVLKAYNTLGFSVTVNPSVSYAGYFNAKDQSIILRNADDTIYHELGHFLAFVAGNVDTKGDFKAVYEAEKNLYSGMNKTYVTQDSSEYFAESYRDYVLNPSGLQAERPQTYASIQAAVGKVTDSWVSKIKMVYSAVWK